MLRNYLRTALRNLWRHKTFSFLNILGLTIGMSACFLILLYVRFELSYDNFHSRQDRIYRMVCNIKTPTELLQISVCSAPMAPNAKLEFPEVDKFVRSTIQRTKEIGIRKVLGAGVPRIVNLLSREFMMLVGIAFLIATPITYYFMHGWLKDFYYRTSIQWWIFLLGGVLALAIALLTISFQAARAAMANPVKALRSE